MAFAHEIRGLLQQSCVNLFRISACKQVSNRLKCSGGCNRLPMSSEYLRSRPQAFALHLPTYSRVFVNGGLHSGNTESTLISIGGGLVNGIQQFHYEFRPLAEVGQLHTLLNCCTYFGGGNLSVFLRRNMEKNEWEPFGHQAGFSLLINGWVGGGGEQAKIPKGLREVM